MSRKDNIIWQKEPNYLYDEEYKDEVFNNEYQEYIDEIYDMYGVSREPSDNVDTDELDINVLTRRNYDTDFADEEDEEAREYEEEMRAEAEAEIKDFDDWYYDYVNQIWEDEQYIIREDWEQSIAPAIDKQINNDCLFLVGYRRDQLSWKNGGGHVQFSDADGLLDWLCGFDDAELYDEDGIITASGHDHDGSTSGTLYTITNDYDLIIDVARQNGFENEIENAREWYSSSATDEDILNDLLFEALENGERIEGLDKLLVPIKNTIWG